MGQIWPKPPTRLGLGQPTMGQRCASAHANGQIDQVQRELLISRSTLHVHRLPASAHDVFNTQKKTGMEFCSPRGFVGCMGVQGEVEGVVGLL